MKTLQNLGLVALAAVAMSFGWWLSSGLPMLAGFVPLLILASRHDASRRSWWRMAGYVMLFFALWYGMTVWWVWLATPAGPIAAVFLAWIYTGLPLMAWFWISKRAPKALSYTFLVSAWTVGEWIYNTNQLSFPWLNIGNGFAHDPWAVQWYEWTGVYGGTVWVLVSSILIYEFLAIRPFRVKNLFAPALAVIVPLAVSLALYFTYDEPTRTARVTVVQPNVDAWAQNEISPEEKTAGLVELISEAPSDTRFIVMPEAAVNESLIEGRLASSPSLAALKGAVAASAPEATIVAGATTYRLYGSTKATDTAHGDVETGYSDHFNSALAVSPDGTVAIHHKAKLVPGAEMTPSWWWARKLLFLIDGLDFYVGQYGYGTARTVFDNESAAVAVAVPDAVAPGTGSSAATGTVRAGAGICWESVYGEYMSEFVRGGAELLFIITNDGWWDDTPGHRQHFDLARLRAIETRRSVARSANTGRSGFISPRGDVLGGDLVMGDTSATDGTLEWNERGVITADLPIDRRITFFVRFGDWPVRVSMLVLGLSILYFVAWRIRRKHLIS
ncbi:MAG: apolipoprotein N-acyltransferase [Alistipes sp.]|jgi:apolipoprotein N-acyltransferase|nr:apolipoprotein N-acyltransferase [Alistipes sp.]